MKSNYRHVILILGVLGIMACSPKVEVEVPEKPITINLNVKVEHEIRVQVDQELDALFEDEDLF